MYTNPVSNEIARPNIGLDKVLNDLVSRFSGIEWLNGFVFLRAYDISSENPVTNKSSSRPQVYFGRNEYYDAMFNDNLPACVFFKTDGAEVITYSRPGNLRSVKYERKMSLIFSGNLQTMEAPYKDDYIYTESIKKEFITTLSGSQYVSAITGYVDDELSEIWKGYTIPEDRRQLAKYPMASLRIDFNVFYSEGINC